MGANWKTTLSGIGAAIFSLLTVLAALPYETGVLAEIFPVEWKPVILKISIVAALVLKIWNSLLQKDKDVTGGVIQQDMDGKAIPPGNSRNLVRTTAQDSAAANKPAP